MKNTDPRYDHSELPSPKNPLLHFYRCMGKINAIIFFGTGGFLLGLIVFPLILLFSWNRRTFKRRAQAFTTFTFKFFIGVLRALQLISFHVEGKEKLKNLKSAVIVANHPSLLDVVMIISQVKNADCIVRGGLTKTPFVLVIKYLYIVNTLGSEEMFELASQSLADGSNLIIFPEGTRTPRHGKNPYKRGAAHIAFNSLSTIVPVYIGGGDKYGLGKHDPFFSHVPDKKMTYNLKVLDPIRTEDFKDMEPQIASRRITELIQNVLDKAAQEEKHEL